MGRTGKVGISCTGSVLLTDWVAQHPAPKLILHRSADQVNDSLERIGLPRLTGEFIDTAEAALAAADGMHIEWRELFVTGVARKAWRYLRLPGEFNDYRHAELVTWHIEPQHDRVLVNPEATQDYLKRITAAARME